MKKTKRGEGRRFKKGVSGNPSGRPKMTEGEAVVRKVSREQFVEVANLLLGHSFEELQQILDKPETPAFMSWMIKVILVASEKGDYGTLDALMNRMIGKVPEKIQTEDLTERLVFKVKWADEDEGTHPSDASEDAASKTN